MTEQKQTLSKFQKALLDAGNPLNHMADEDLQRADEASGTVTYLGYSQAAGTLDSEPKWKIKRITVSGTVTKFEYANGSRAYDQIWTNRASLTYK